VPLLREAIEGRRLKLDEMHPRTQESIKTLIDLYKAWGKPKEAEEFRALLPPAEEPEE
jgi:hypothetical protein